MWEIETNRNNIDRNSHQLWTFLVLKINKIPTFSPKMPISALRENVTVFNQMGHIYCFVDCFLCL